MFKSTRKLLLTLFIFQFFYTTLIAQIEIPVDLNTGKPSISIPIHTIRSHDLTLPVSIYYNPGVQVSQDIGDYDIGIGWELSAGGKITRTVKSLPDDRQGSQMGWLYSGSSFSVRSLAIAGTTNCNDQTNYNAINALSSNDTEPDVFNYSCGGISGQFVFDNDKVIQTIPYEDVNISVSSTSSNGVITGFIITTNNGVKYKFVATKTLKVTVFPGSANLEYLKNIPNKYASEITYVSEWGIESITSPSGAYIYLLYSDFPEEVSSAPTKIYLKDNNTFGLKVIYTTQKSTVRRVITDIYGEGRNRLEFSFIDYPKKKFDKFKVYVEGQLTKSIELVRFMRGDRDYLHSFYETADCLKSPPYEFEYSGITNTSSLSLLPSKDSKEQDYWGYYNANGAITLNPNLHVYPNEQDKYRLYPIPAYTGTYIHLSGGANRNVNPETISAGSLNKILLPTGGTATLEYESNEYFDALAGTSFKGGGIRVKKVTLHDGVSVANNIVKEYSFSGGVLVNRPQFVVPLPYYMNSSGVVTTIEQMANSPLSTIYEHFIGRSDMDLNIYSYDDSKVRYASGEERQIGKGKVVHHYHVPASFGQTTSSEYTAPNHWEATYSRVAPYFNSSTNICTSKGLVSDGYFSFPYPSNTNYDFERGLLKSQKIYNEASQLLKENIYEYTPVYKGTGPVLIHGLTLDYAQLPGSSANKVYSFGKYKLLSGVVKLISKQKEIVWDPTNLARSSVKEINSFFNGANHALTSSTTTAVSDDGINFTTFKTTYKYPDDYLASTSGDPATASIKMLQQAFIKNVVVEKASFILKPNQAEKLINADLTKFGNFSHNNADRIFPVEFLTLKTDASTSGFTASSVLNSSQFIHDARYKQAATFQNYDSWGNLTTKKDHQQNLSSEHYDPTGQFVIADIQNAAWNEVVYSNFDNPINNYQPMPVQMYFTAPSQSSTYLEGKNGFGVSVAPNQPFVRQSVSKSNEAYCILSCWIKTGNSGIMTVNLSDAGNHSNSANVGYTSSPNQWILYKVKVPVTSLNSLFNVQVQFSTPVYVDDMLFRPEGARVSLSAYKNNMRISDTDIRGNSLYYEYDALGRLTLVRDKDKNIVKRQIYNYQNSVAVDARFKVASPANIKVNQAVNFQTLANTTCEVPGMVRNWNFGDGSTLSNGGTSPSHTYSTPGNYVITLTTTHPQYGTDSKQVNIAVYEPFSVSLCTGGFLAFNVCAQTGSGSGVCGILPAGSNTFSATIKTPCSGGGTYSYKWERGEGTNPTTWETLPDIGTQISVTTIPIGGLFRSNQTYTIRCTVSASCFAEPQVNTTTIVFYKTNCNL